MTQNQNHDSIYAQAEFYDIAFDYRDVESECDFLLQLSQVHGSAVRHVLELAAGPGRHALAFARRGKVATALDLSANMVAYGQTLAHQQGLNLNYLQGDMRDFVLETPVELAFSLIDSASYLLTQADFLAHLQAVYQALRPGGIYVLEMAHPRDLLTPEPSVSTSWTQERDGIQVEMQWGQAGDQIDPVTQITQVHVCVRVQRDGEHLEFSELAAQRAYTWPELQLLFELSPLKLSAVYGGFHLDCRLNDAQAWRTIAVLQRPRAQAR